MVKTLFYNSSAAWKGNRNPSPVRTFITSRPGVIVYPYIKYIKYGDGLMIKGLPNSGVDISVTVDPSSGIATDSQGRLTIDPEMLEARITAAVEHAAESGIVVTTDVVRGLVTDVAVGEGYTKIAIKPFGFTLSHMTDDGNNERSINVPGFVFKVMNDVTGVVICNTIHNGDGSSTIVFTDMDVEDSGENESFTAYSFINSDGSVIPMLSKTNL